MENLSAAYFRSNPARAFIDKMEAVHATNHVPIMGIRGSLRAIRRFIVAMILEESVIMYSLGALLGICVIETVRIINISKISTLQASISSDDSISSMMLGLIAGTMGAIYPAYKAARVDPERALSFR